MNSSPDSTRPSYPMLIGYAVIVLAIMGAYYSGAITSILPDHLKNTAESAVGFASITIVGAIAIKLRSPAVWTVIIAVLASFFVITTAMDPLLRYLILGATLFAIGVYGMVVSRNAVRVLMCIELLLNAVNINLVAFSRYVDPANVKGQIFAVFILTVAAAEAAVGLAIVLAVYRNMATVDMERFNLLKW